MVRSRASASPWRVGTSHVRIGAMNELQYRANFFFALVQSMLALGTALVVLGIIFRQTSNLAGWTRWELLVVYGVFTLVYGVLSAFVQPNMQRIVNEIREGKLDYALVRPADSQVLVSLRDIRFWALTDVLVGLIIIAISAVQLDELSVAHIAAFIGTLILGLICIYCFWLMLASAAFWLVRINEVQELFDGLYRAGRYPTGIYPRWMRTGLTVLVPLAFAITVPSEAITGRLAAGSFLGSLAAAAILLVVSRLLWKKGLRRYDGASS
jgi:ABC-2 type transport system permease protein